jgi:hypothetical protein
LRLADFPDTRGLPPTRDFNGRSVTGLVTIALLSPEGIPPNWTPTNAAIHDLRHLGVVVHAMQEAGLMRARSEIPRQIMGRRELGEGMAEAFREGWNWNSSLAWLHREHLIPLGYEPPGYERLGREVGKAAERVLQRLASQPATDRGAPRRRPRTFATGRAWKLLFVDHLG